jgi:3-oxoacyl-[acyl-carrier-protein] synthase II
MLAGGTEALFAFVSIKAWQALHVLAPPLAEDVAASCRPFSADRNGTVLGEGAAFLILEEMERAARRGAHVYAEVAGFGHCNDFAHLTQPSIDGQSRSMSLALADAQAGPSDIDYINAHGTGTVLNDLVETAAVKAVFGSDARRLAISSTKSMHGHLVGAAGAFECLLTALAIDKQVIPPTAHLRKPDADCDLDYVPLIGRRAPVRAAISNSFAVGGTAASLLLTRPQ